MTELTAAGAAALPPNPDSHHITGAEPLIPGSVEARLLAGVWAGDRVTVVDSPPGGGKSTLIGWLCHQLLERTDLTIAVAAPTRNATAKLHQRIQRRVGPDHHIWLKMSGNVANAPIPEAGQTQRVVVSTLDSRAVTVRDEVDVLIVDEAYQATFAKIATAGQGASQLVLIGDPGQIGPVIRSHTGVFDNAYGPHVRSPEVFLKHEETVRLSLPATHRLGDTTRGIVAEFYDFDFTSARPDRTATLPGGTTLPEVSHRRIAPTRGVNNADHIQEIADIVRGLIGSTITEADGTTNVCEPADICVVTSHNAQCDRLADIFAASETTKGIKTGTADRLQGGEWPIVVAVDPLVGHRTAGSHQLSPGRLCVMLSRHSTALVWLHDGQPGRLETLANDDQDAATGLRVREHILTNPAFPQH